jgi:23S rRNA (pseudouridine1915-N3)-methyltransferase
MKITVIGVGKIKEKYWNMAIDEYAKRLSRYCRLELVEVADEKTPDEAGEALETQIKDREGQRILDKIPEGAYVVALAIEGVMLDSVALSKKLEDIALRGSSHIVFIIGGSLGLSKNVLQRADYLLSFSRMTFPHQMMRVVLLEQIYRSFRISNHEPYHK